MNVFTISLDLRSILSINPAVSKGPIILNKDNIKMDLQEVGRGYGDWLELARDRDRWRALVSTVMNFRVP